MKYENESSFRKAVRNFDRAFPNAFWEIINEPKRSKFGIRAFNNKEDKEFLIKDRINDLPSFKKELHKYFIALVALNNIEQNLLNKLVGQDLTCQRNKFPSYLKLVK